MPDLSERILQELETGPRRDTELADAIFGGAGRYVDVLTCLEKLRYTGHVGYTATEAAGVFQWYRKAPPVE